MVHVYGILGTIWFAPLLWSSILAELWSAGGDKPAFHHTRGHKQERDGVSAKSYEEAVSNPLFRKLDCYSLPVANLDSAIAFYGGLGHRLLWRDGDNAAGLSLPDADSEIVLHTGDRPAETYFLVKSVPEAIERVRRAGGQLMIGPTEIGPGLYAMLHDPWGNPLVVIDFSKGLLLTDPDGNVIGNHATE